MKVLFIGGTGILSAAAAALAVERGVDLTLLNRGETTRPVPAGAEVLIADARDDDATRSALAGRRFDAIVEFIAYTPAHIEADLRRFHEHTDQYVFISSASAYQTPPARLPVLESTPLANAYWRYSQNKIACEDLLVRAYREQGFPITIVRPSHTYDERSLPFDHGYTVVDRMRRGAPVVVHGDGSSLWVLTHTRDFAVGLVGLLGNPHAIGESFHVTSDELLSWDQIYETVAKAAGASADIVHVASDVIAAFDPAWGARLLGDKARSMIFDNAKIKATVPEFVAKTPFARGAEEILAWFDADPARQRVDDAADALMDRLVAAQASALPQSSPRP